MKILWVVLIYSYQILKLVVYNVNFDSYFFYLSIKILAVVFFQFCFFTESLRTGGLFGFLLRRAQMLQHDEDEYNDRAP